MSDYTTIRVSKTTRDRLALFGTKNEEYNDLINRLLDEIEKKR